MAEYPHFLLGSITRVIVTITDDDKREDEGKEGREGRGRREEGGERGRGGREHEREEVKKKGGREGVPAAPCMKGAESFSWHERERDRH